MQIRTVHEVVLYAHDVATAANFYRDLLQLRAIGMTDGQSAALRLPEGDAVLLIFNPVHAALPNRGVPTHAGRAPGHLALRVDKGSLDAWKAHFEKLAIPIEMDRTWERGGRSVYVRDPAGNSVELVDGEIWAK